MSPPPLPARLTTVRPVRKLTTTPSTPFSLRIARSTRPWHMAQVMPPTTSDTICCCRRPCCSQLSSRLSACSCCGDPLEDVGDDERNFKGVVRPPPRRPPADAPPPSRSGAASSASLAASSSRCSDQSIAVKPALSKASTIRCTMSPPVVVAPAPSPFSSAAPTAASCCCWRPPSTSPGRTVTSTLASARLTLDATTPSTPFSASDTHCTQVAHTMVVTCSFILFFVFPIEWKAIEKRKTNRVKK